MIWRQLDDFWKLMFDANLIVLIDKHGWKYYPWQPYSTRSGGLVPQFFFSNQFINLKKYGNLSLDYEIHAKEE